MATTTLGIPTIASTDLVQNGPTQIDAALTFIDGLLPHVVTTLPGSPVDQQVIDYVADATNGVVWRFRYRAASSSAHKWEFVGGAALLTFDTGTHSGTSSATPNTALAPNTANALTLPFAGDYDVDLAATQYSPTPGTAIGVNVGTTSAPATTLVSATALGGYLGAASGQYGAVTAFGRLPGAAAGAVITPTVYFDVASVAWTILSMSLRVIPVRVG